MCENENIIFVFFNFIVNEHREVEVYFTNVSDFQHCTYTIRGYTVRERNEKKKTKKNYSSPTSLFSPSISGFFFYFNFNFDIL